MRTREESMSWDAHLENILVEMGMIEKRYHLDDHTYESRHSLSALEDDEQSRMDINECMTRFGHKMTEGKPKKHY